MGFAPVPSEATYLAAFRAFLLSILPVGIEVVQAQQNRVPVPIGPDYVIINTVMRERLSLNVKTYADCAITGSVSGLVLTVSAVQIGPVIVGATLSGTGILPLSTILAQTSGTAGGAGTYSLNQAQLAPVSGVPLAAGAALIMQPTRVTIQVDVYGPNSAANVQTITTLWRDDYAALWFSRGGYFDQGMGVLDCSEPRQLAFQDAEQQYEDRYTADLVLQVNQVVSPSQDFADAVRVTINTPADAVRSN